MARPINRAQTGSSTASPPCCRFVTTSIRSAYTACDPTRSTLSSFAGEAEPSALQSRPTPVCVRHASASTLHCSGLSTEFDPGDELNLLSALYFAPYERNRGRGGWLINCQVVLLIV